MERQPELLGEEKVVVALNEVLVLAGLEVHVGVTDTPRVFRVEDEPVLEADTEAVEAIITQIVLRLAIAGEKANSRTELLVEAESDAFADDVRLAVVRPEPQRDRSLLVTRRV